MIEPLKNIPVRFFIYAFDVDEQEWAVHEVDEADFLEAEGAIKYERHKVRENGVSQICLTKDTAEG